jgi:serine/threonine protein kinase
MYSNHTDMGHGMADTLERIVKLGPYIAHGSYGKVYRGRLSETGEAVAVKLEANQASCPQLRYEAKLYRTLGKKEASRVPNLRWFGSAMHGSALAMVIDLKGPDLDSLQRQCGGRFSKKTVCTLAGEMIDSLAYLHSSRVLHRDVKPANFVIGSSSHADSVHIIDFGLAKVYRDKSGAHIPYKEGKTVHVGTLRYGSLRAHMGIEQGRRDDLEALGYVLMYFLKGSLPWQDVHLAEDSKHKTLAHLKMTMLIKELSSGFPAEFAAYFDHVKNLGFDEEPDYAYSKQLFKNLLSKSGLVDDGVYDWASSPESDNMSKQSGTEADKSNSQVVASSSIGASHGSTSLSSLAYEHSPQRYSAKSGDMETSVTVQTTETSMIAASAKPH